MKVKQDLLLERIKSLDAQFAREEIDETEYQKTREVAKELLVGVKIKLKEL